MGAETAGGGGPRADDVARRRDDRRLGVTMAVTGGAALTTPLFFLTAGGSFSSSSIPAAPALLPSFRRRPCFLRSFAPYHIEPLLRLAPPSSSERPSPSAATLFRRAPPFWTAKSLSFAWEKRRRRWMNCSGGEDDAGSATIQEEPLIALLEKALQAGRHSWPEQVHPPEYPSKEGFPLMQMLTRAPFLTDDPKKPSTLT